MAAAERSKKPMDWIVEGNVIFQRVVERKRQGLRVGLVPTMGNLHEGHASLMRRARKETDEVVVSIFVNPIQFVQGEDYETYPRTPEDDRKLCEGEGVDAVFAPNVEGMYPSGWSTQVQVNGLDQGLCGPRRPGHFAGVATVLTKLFHLVPADLAYFGLKDYQQVKVIERMVRDLDFPLEVVACPTIREADGLAKSSRNAYLSREERRQATVLWRGLSSAADAVEQGERNADRLRRRVADVIAEAPLGHVDYIELVDAELLTPVSTIDRPTLLALAVTFGRARLIDNAVLIPKEAIG